MDGALDQWEEEEDDERRRQLESRWAHFEQGFPTAVKCRERVRYEQNTAKLALLTRRAQERSKRTKQDVTQELLAYLHAADRLYNDILAGVLMLEGPSEMATVAGDKGSPKAVVPADKASTSHNLPPVEKPQSPAAGSSLSKDAPADQPADATLVATAIIAPSPTATSPLVPISAQSLPIVSELSHPRSQAISAGKSPSNDDGLGDEQPFTPRESGTETSPSPVVSISDSGLCASPAVESNTVPILLLAGSTTTASKTEAGTSLANMSLADAAVTESSTEPAAAASTHPRGAARRVSHDPTTPAVSPRVEPLVAHRAQTFESSSASVHASAPAGTETYQKIEQRLAEREAQRKLEQQLERQAREAAIQQEIELKRQSLQKAGRASQDKDRDGKEPRLSFLRRSLRRLSTNSDGSDGSRGSRRSQRRDAKAKAKADKRKSRLSMTSEDIEYDNLREGADAIVEEETSKAKGRGGKLGDLIRMFEPNKADSARASSPRRSIKKMFRRSKKGKDQSTTPSISEDVPEPEPLDDDDVVPLPARASISLGGASGPVQSGAAPPEPVATVPEAAATPLSTQFASTPLTTMTTVTTVTDRRPTGVADASLASKLRRASQQADAPQASAVPPLVAHKVGLCVSFLACLP